MKNEQGRTMAGYGVISRVNHWVVGLLIIGLLSVGTFLANGPLGFMERAPIRDTHKAIGTVVLILGLWRVGWRLRKGFLPDASVMPVWQSKLAHVIHATLLIGVLVMPISGLMGSYFSARPTDVFGLFTVPGGPLIEWVANAAGSVHGIMGKVMIAAVLLHIAGALKHHFVDRDQTLERMTRGAGDGRG